MVNYFGLNAEWWPLGRFGDLHLLEGDLVEQALLLVLSRTGHTLTISTHAHTHLNWSIGVI